MGRVRLRAVELHSLGRYACGKGGRDAFSAESATKMLAHPLPPAPPPHCSPSSHRHQPRVAQQGGRPDSTAVGLGAGESWHPRKLKAPPTHPRKIQLFVKVSPSGFHHELNYYVFYFYRKKIPIKHILRQRLFFTL